MVNKAETKTEAERVIHIQQPQIGAVAIIILCLLPDPNLSITSTRESKVTVCICMHVDLETI